MTTDNDPVPAGRPIRLVPMAPGVWTILLGSGVMLLGPLFGFLFGTMVGTEPETWGMSPIFLYLFIGFIVAGLGLGVVLLGARTVIRNMPPWDESDDEGGLDEPDGISRS